MEVCNTIFAEPRAEGQLDIRIMNEEQAFYLNKLRLQRSIHIAWDLPSIDLTDKLKEVLQYIKPWKLMCYVLVGFDSTVE